MDPQVWFFRGLNLHERLPQNVIQHLKQEGRLERWGHQADIFHDADDGRVYVVLSGNVYIHDNTSSQRTRLHAGDAFGGLVADDVLPQNSNTELRRNLQAFDDTLLVSINRLQFEALMHPHLETLQTSIGALAKKRELSIPISPILFSSPSNRFAKVFLHLAETHGQINGSSAQIDFPFHPKKIAPLLGVERPHSKYLAEQFMRRGLIENSPKFIIIPDMDALRKILL